jgi:hypothetical protein
MSFKSDVRTRLEDIKVELARNTVETLNVKSDLHTHHVRTSNIEARLKPIENHVEFIGKTLKILIPVLTGVMVYAIVHYFFK